MKLADVYNEIVELQTNNCSDDELRAKQAELKSAYDTFTKNGSVLINELKKNTIGLEEPKKLRIPYRTNDKRLFFTHKWKNLIDFLVKT